MGRGTPAGQAESDPTVAGSLLQLLSGNGESQRANSALKLTPTFQRSTSCGGAVWSGAAQGSPCLHLIGLLAQLSSKPLGRLPSHLIVEQGVPYLFRNFRVASLDDGSAA